MTVPSKREFAKMINQVTGNQEMTEQKLNRILREAKKSYQQNGMTGFFDYIRKIISAPVSNEYMLQLMKKLQDPAYTDQFMKQLREAERKNSKR